MTMPLRAATRRDVLLSGLAAWEERAKAQAPKAG